MYRMVSWTGILAETNMARHDDCSAPRHLPLGITKETFVSMSMGICFVCRGTRAPVRWFNRYAYLKLGIFVA